jgi:hypothetical protein
MNHSITSARFGIASLALLLASAGIGRAAAPTIAAAAPVEIFYNASVPGDAQFGYRIVTTGSPTSFDATGLPPDATLDRTTGWINGNRNRPGTYDVTVRATNADGVATATVRLAIHAAATGVISSQGNFRAGQNFTFTVRYNTPVTVTGTPQLTLAIGSLATPDFKAAVYLSGSGTNELVFGLRRHRHRCLAGRRASVAERSSRRHHRRRQRPLGFPFAARAALRLRDHDRGDVRRIGRMLV